MAQFYTFCVLLLLSISFSMGQNPGKKIVLDISDFVDRANPLITTIIADNNHNLLQLPNTSAIASLSKVHLTNIYLHDLSKIYRNKPAVLTYEKRQLVFDISLEVKNVSITGDYYVRHLLAKRYGKVLTVASPLGVDISINFDLENSKSTLTKFYINEFKTIETVLVDGDNSAWTKRAVSITAKRVFLNYIRNTGAEKISKIIQSFFDKFGPAYVNEIFQL